MRSRNDCPGSCVISTTIRSDSTRVPPVTALRSPPDSRMTGADSPVIADSSTEAMPSIDGAVAGDQLAGLDDDDVAAAQLGGRLRRCRRAARAVVCLRIARSVVGLRLAAALGDRLGEVAEEHREPQPDRDREREPAGPGRARRRSTCTRREQRADLDHEHDRVADHVARVELAQRAARSPREDGALEQRALGRSVIAGLVSARLSSSTLIDFGAGEPEQRAARVVVDQREHAGERQAALARDAVGLDARVGLGDVAGRRPRPTS